MATRDIYQQNREARAADRMIDGGTVNPAATPGAGRGSRNGEPATPSWAGGEHLMLKQSPGTPRLNNLSLTNPDATAESNRSGAFGTGAQNLQKRKDLFAQMAGPQGEERTADYFKRQAAQLGVTPGGWASALGKLNMTPPVGQPSQAAAPVARQAPAAPVSPLAKAAAVTPPTTWSGNPWNVSPAAIGAPKPGIAQVAGLAPNQPAQNTLAQTASTPNPAPTAPLPNQTPAVSPIAAATLPTTPPGSMLRPPAATPTWASAAGIPPRKPTSPIITGGPMIYDPAKSAQKRKTQRDQEVSKLRASKRNSYNRVWNATPDMGFVDPYSITNKTYKSVRTFLSGHSY